MQDLYKNVVIMYDEGTNRWVTFGGILSKEFTSLREAKRALDDLLPYIDHIYKNQTISYQEQDSAWVIQGVDGVWFGSVDYAKKFIDKVTGGENGSV